MRGETGEEQRGEWESGSRGTERDKSCSGERRGREGPGSKRRPPFAVPVMLIKQVGVLLIAL